MMHRDADRDRQRGWIAAFFGAGGLQRSAALGQPGWLAQPGGVPAIGVACGELQHARLGGCDHDLRATSSWAARAQFTVGRAIVSAGKIHPALAQQRCDDLERLLEAIGLVIEWDTKGVEFWL